MNSYNHYSYGAIGDWMYRTMVGIDTYEDGVGYKHIKIQPHIGGGFTYASASLQTYYGQISSGWKVGADKILMDVEIPANTSATVFVPTKKLSAVSESGGFVIPANAKVEEGYLQITLGSGIYHFSILN